MSEKKQSSYARLKEKYAKEKASLIEDIRKLVLDADSLEGVEVVMRYRLRFDFEDIRFPKMISDEKKEMETLSYLTSGIVPQIVNVDPQPDLCCGVYQEDDQASLLELLKNKCPSFFKEEKQDSPTTSYKFMIIDLSKENNEQKKIL